MALATLGPDLRIGKSFASLGQNQPSVQVTQAHGAKTGRREVG
ncbi:hypothetical protein [Polaromonas sp. CG9_12]|nr:hypothetical protein [Polaromonas sp. CG9_12]